MWLEKRERPDFVLQLLSVSIGIEVTEAVPPDWAWADARRQKLKHELPILLQRFRPGERQRSAAEIDRIATGASRSDGWVGDAPEREWAEVMRHFSRQKAKKFQGTGFAHFPVNWLAIYDNWPLPAVDDPTAAAYLARQLYTADDSLPFDAVFVECEKRIWQFFGSTSVSHSIPDLWSS
jgi:hypothetical protein